jgi:UDP:flavonoid glycosyltransferase YjiC (YdhE family)
MRFLFTVQPTFGHFHATAPAAVALKEQGHEVAFATGASFGAVIERMGFVHFPCGLDFDGSKDVLESLPGRESLQARFSGSAAIQQLYGFVEELAPIMTEDLIQLVEAWRPDLIVRDPLEYGGYIAAERAGLPHATITWGIYIPAQLICPDALAALRQRYGLPADPGLKTIDQYLALNFLPPSWKFPDSPVEDITYRFCAPPFDRSFDEGLPDWIYTLPDQPTVHVSLGTTFNQSPGTFLAILDALHTEKVNVIMTIGRTMDPAQFGPQPDQIKIVQYIPQSRLHPHCDAMIFHGGYNTLHSALWHGLPMVITPLRAGDNAPNAQQCQALGVGIVVEGDPPKAKAIREALRIVLEQPSYRERSRARQREIRGLPDLSEAVKRLERLAINREPQRK